MAMKIHFLFFRVMTYHTVFQAWQIRWNVSHGHHFLFLVQVYQQNYCNFQFQINIPTKFINKRVKQRGLIFGKGILLRIYIFHMSTGYNFRLPQRLGRKKMMNKKTNTFVKTFQTSKIMYIDIEPYALAQSVQRRATRWMARVGFSAW
jgi:hypothetical protein